MTLVLDHCVPRRYHRLLSSWNYRVEFSSAHLSQDAPDKEVIALARRLDAALLTVDLDFANILEYRPADYQGIIVLRYQVDEEAELDAALKSMLADLYRDALRGALVIVSPGRYRVRRA
jgi:predicted nuclease of predicted toxin-antitoxin system